jgi:hypothetical protein
MSAAGARFIHMGRIGLGIMVIALTVAGARTASASSASFYCGDRIVDSGQTTAEVAGRCGAPSFVEHRDEVRGTVDAPRTVAVDSWTYDRGPGQLVRILTFVDGTLRRIESGGYGQ